VITVGKTTFGPVWKDPAIGLLPAGEKASGTREIALRKRCMMRTLRVARLPMSGIVVLAAALLAEAWGGRGAARLVEADRGNFNPGLAVSLSNTAAGGPTNLRTKTNIPRGDQLYSSAIFFHRTPGGLPVDKFRSRFPLAPARTARKLLDSVILSSN
jgi:hypothetical protein